MTDRVRRLWPETIREWRVATELEGAPFVVAVNRLVGLGPGASLVLTARSSGLSAPPHNDFLRMLVEYGLVGLALFLAVLTVLPVLAFQTWKKATAVNHPSADVALAFLSATLAFSIMSLTDNVFGYTANQVYFWTLAGLTVAVQRAVESPHSEVTEARRLNAAPRRAFS